jgi:hypothetical protein
MTFTTARLKLWFPLLGAVAACSDFWGPGPDPSRAGPFLGVSGRSAGGTAGNGAGGEPSTCASEPLSLLLERASANCAEVRACAKASCNDMLQQCLGNNYDRGVVSGPCQSYVDCAAGCNCDEGCLNGCGMSGGDACLNCVMMVQTCMLGACAPTLEACQSTNGKPTVLVSNLSSNPGALALDGEFVYFTTGQGVAKIPKTGGKAQALGGFPNLNGIAVGGGFIYVVLETGSVSRMKLDGSQPTTIVSTNVGGGSGPIMFDEMKLFFLGGNLVRRAPLAGGAVEQLANDGWQGGPNSSLRLALDASAIYYVAGGFNPGATSQVSMLSKDAAAIGMDAPGMHGGTSLAAAHGEIRSLTSDGKLVYFSDFTSDGLKPVVEIRKLDPSTKESSVLAAVSPMMNGGGGSTPVATDGKNVFFGGATGLYSVGVKGGSVTVLDESSQAIAIALDDGYVYWADQLNNSSIKRVPKLGGAAL